MLVRRMAYKEKIRIVGNNKISNAKTRLHSINPVPELIQRFPSTRYYGSKKKLLPWIFDNIKSLKFRTVLDGFGGTGSVSLLFKAMGKDVTYHDGFQFNRHVAQTVLRDKIAVDAETFKQFVNHVNPRKGFIYRQFKGLYYTDDENCWLDGFSNKLLLSGLSKPQVSLYLYTLFQACLKKRPFNLFHRANLNLRLNKKVSRTFGNKTTWERSFEELMVQSYQELSSSIFNGISSTNISNSSSVTRLSGDYDLVYLDPPYVSLSEKNNHDDYWRRYHFLEGLCCYIEWPYMIDHNSRLKEMYQPKHFSDWSRKSTFKKKLFGLIEKHKKSTVVLSYVSGAFPDEGELIEYFESCFPITSFHSKDHSHALCKSRKRELLFIGRHK